LGTNTGKRQILRSTQLYIATFFAAEASAAAYAALLKNHFVAKYVTDCPDDLFYVIVAFNREQASITVIFQAQMYQVDEFFFLQPRKLKPFTIQNNSHSKSEPAHFN
jgi:hypothetical protein